MTKFGGMIAQSEQFQSENLFCSAGQIEQPFDIGIQTGKPPTHFLFLLRPQVNKISLSVILLRRSHFLF
jgi:hypothetical protein